MARAKHIKRKASDKARRALIRYNLQNPDTGVISVKITSAYTGGNGARANIGIPQCSTIRGNISSNVIGQMRSVAMSPKTKITQNLVDDTFQAKAMRGYAKPEKQFKSIDYSKDLALLDGLNIGIIREDMKD